ncbi:GerAB/ArcD/ProY family transporter [Brevibacillus centrosporus]|uniref:GerAB/ArcD/ProY family transporter n=1 Tax=Brevibacillus centrosporus TaxID=54910 RepID=UPI000F0A73A3|nr:GerAB/ArcD/ProY family transporter [Brevibacillus centrosporus]MEC2133238.1 GerAB/ArcD/ProY family transporter [Brevibacillus centrosporus]RNB64977.1 spore gernimation protein [Brevibacillus centrosporus]GED34408.1 hypothetical protein BCE02nite_55490 [Brevibacillus centrosporus]
MTALSLFEKSTTYNGAYIFMMANRFQMLYFVFIMPTYLIHPYMIWGIVLVGILSHFNLMLLSKWFRSRFATKGYDGFVEVFGETLVRFFAWIGLFFLLLKASIILIGYVEIVRTFIYPSMNQKWLILFMLMISWYVASKGMETTIRLIVIAFFMIIWIILLIVPFYLPPIAAFHDLFPLIPLEWTEVNWEGLLFIWSSLSGPEYLICLGPWLRPNENTFKSLAYANALTVLEYLLLFVGSLFFFGSNYVSTTIYPVVNMYRYLQSPVIERIDMLLISIYLFQFVFAISVLLLCFYGVARIAGRKTTKPTSRMGYFASWLTILACTMIINEWAWNGGTVVNRLLNLQIWSGAITYLLVPSFLLISIYRKGRV